MFENPEIALDALPNADDLDWLALHPRFKRRLQVQMLLILLGVVAAPIAVSLIPGMVPLPIILTWSLWSVLGIALLTWPTISLPRRGYVLRDKDILFRKGVVWRSITAIPFNRIQHVETSSTPLDRKFDVATLQLFTAGGSSGDLKIDGLGSDTAEQLRVFVLEKAGASIESA